MSPRSGSAESALSSESMKKMRKSRGICPASSRITVCSDDTVICSDTPTEQPDEPDKPNVPFGRMDREVRIIVMGKTENTFLLIQVQKRRSARQFIVVMSKLKKDWAFHSK